MYITTLRQSIYTYLDLQVERTHHLKLTRTLPAGGFECYVRWYNASKIWRLEGVNIGMSKLNLRACHQTCNASLLVSLTWFPSTRTHPRGFVLKRKIKYLYSFLRLLQVLILMVLYSITKLSTCTPTLHLLPVLIPRGTLLVPILIRMGMLCFFFLLGLRQNSWKYVSSELYTWPVLQSSVRFIHWWLHHSPRRRGILSYLPLHRSC